MTSHGRHITLVNDFSTCLTTVPSQTTMEPINGNPCNMNDDTNQIDQFWVRTFCYGVYLY